MNSIAIVAAVWTVAQAAPDDPVTTLWISLIGSSPLAAVTGYWAHSERSDRRASEKQLQAERAEHIALLERLLPLVVDSTAALKEVNESLSYEVEAATKRRVSVSPGIERRLDDLIEYLQSQR